MDDVPGEWVSIADTEEIDFSASTEVALEKWNSKYSIFFKPDGYLYDGANNLISEQRIVFKYGSSAVAVDINALGVISSEAISDEDNDYFSDDYDPNTDNQDNYPEL